MLSLTLISVYQFLASRFENACLAENESSQTRYFWNLLVWKKNRNKKRSRRKWLAYIIFISVIVLHRSKKCKKRKKNHCQSFSISIMRVSFVNITILFWAEVSRAYRSITYYSYWVRSSIFSNLFSASHANSRADNIRKRLHVEWAFSKSNYSFELCVC